MSAVIRIGLSGWSYKDWKGIVYPSNVGSKFDVLNYVASYFDMIEINSSFYRAPSAKNAASWVSRVELNPKFMFTAKLYRAFTHYLGSATKEDESAFKSGIEPLVNAGKFGALLLQFPWSFTYTKENRQYLSDLLEQFREYPLVIEIRHTSWNKPSVYQSLEKRDIGFCNIDQPVFAKSIEPSAHATSKVGYVRLHRPQLRNMVWQFR